jgi:hypothetical protein
VSVMANKLRLSTIILATKEKKKKNQKEKRQRLKERKERKGTRKEENRALVPTGALGVSVMANKLRLSTIV